MALEGAFKGKRVLITGAATGIGYLVAKRLDSYGAFVIAVSRNEDNLRKLKAECPRIEIHSCDITNWEQTEQVFGGIGRVDCLLNNSGTGIVKTLMDSGSAEYDTIFNTNVKGSWHVSQLVGRKMVEGGKGGQIVFVSSIAGGTPTPLFGLYSLTKATIEMMTQILAIELGPHRISVNCVRPGPVDTPLLKVAEKGVAGVFGVEDAYKRFMEPRTPFAGQYLMENDTVVNIIAFYLSGLAPQVTGNVGNVDGGFLLT